jgi:hypothetical protein
MVLGAAGKWTYIVHNHARNILAKMKQCTKFQNEGPNAIR